MLLFFIGFLVFAAKNLGLRARFGRLQGPPKPTKKKFDGVSPTGLACTLAPPENPRGSPGEAPALRRFSHHSSFSLATPWARTQAQQREKQRIRRRAEQQEREKQEKLRKEKDRKAKAALSSKFKVQGIPTLVVLDAAGKLVPPGVYVYRLVIGSDDTSSEQVGTVSLAY